MLKNRLDPAAAPMAVGDFAVVAVAFAAGTARHHGPGVIVSDPLYVLATIAPFLLGWAVAGPLLGAYAPGVVQAPRKAVVRGAGAWVVADAIALGLRSSPVVRGGTTPSFVLVTLIVGAGSLAAWRALYTSRRDHHET